MMVEIAMRDLNGKSYLVSIYARTTYMDSPVTFS